MGNGLPRLPRFRPRGLVGASDLTAIGQVQAYISQSAARANMPWEWMVRSDVRYVVHRSRYLHWKITAIVGGAHLYVNGTNVATASATTGVVDLDPLGLSFNQVYTVSWEDADGVFCTRLYESASETGVLTLPSATPTFSNGNTAPADDLNAVSAGTKYLLDNATNLPNLGFVGKTYFENFPNHQITWTMVHRQRYLLVNLDVRYGDDVGAEEIRVEVEIDTTLIWSTEVNGSPGSGGRYKYAFTWIDLQGTDHSEHGYTDSGSGTPAAVEVVDGSSLGLSVGDEYRLRITIESDTKQSELRTFQLAEYPAKWVA